MSAPAGPPRPGSWLTSSASGEPVPSGAPAVPPAPTGGAPTGGAPAGAAPTGDGLAASLEGLPVSAHADVLTAEHDRLHRLLATIDQL